jgi:hypothetical protein
MSLQFTTAGVALLVSFNLACATVAAPSTTATPGAAANAPLADIIADARTLEQPSNAARLEAVQGLLRKRGLTYSCLRFPAFPASDDRSFQAAGIPAISMAVLPALEAHQVWLLLNGGKESGLAPGFAPSILRTIHTSADTADKLSPQGMTLIYNAVLGLLLELDAR